MTLTCAQLILALTNPAPGAVFTLAPGQVCPAFIYKAKPRTQITLNAGGSILRGWRFPGSNLRIRGGQLMSTKGSVIGPEGYGAHVSGTNIRLEAVTVTYARKGIVVDLATNLTIVDAKFTAVFEDGIIASRTRGLTVLRSVFSDTIGKQTECATVGKVLPRLSRRDCQARGGLWKDGYHADAIQMRNAVTDARIEGNTISGPTQGITQMDTTGDLPLERVQIVGNAIRTDAPHKITLGNCIDCSISGNRAASPPGSKWKPNIIAGQAAVSRNVIVPLGK